MSLGGPPLFLETAIWIYPPVTAVFFWIPEPKHVILVVTATPWVGSRSNVNSLTLEVQPPFFIGWFLNHHYFSRGLSSSKRNHHF